MPLTGAEIQRNYRERRAQGVPLRKRRLVTSEGRECAYGGPGNCGHTFKLWHEYSPGAGPHGKERRCKACLVVKATAYAQQQPDPVKQRRNARQKVYQQTDVGKENNRRAKIKFRYGVSVVQYDWLWDQQGGLCYFCGFGETVIHHASGEVMRLGVEHSHSCAQDHEPKRGCVSCVRGLACYNCNIFIERAERSEILRPRIADLLARRPLLAPGAPV